MMKRIIKVLAFACVVCECSYSADRDVRLAVEDVTTAASAFRCDADVVRNWGLGASVTTQECFSVLVGALTSNQTAIVTDWNYYSTNAFAREIVLCAGHYGTVETHVGIYSNMLEVADLASDTNFCKGLAGFADGAATPLENYMALHYDEPAISNLWIKTVQFLSQNTNMLNYVNFITNKVMTGEFRLRWNAWEEAGLHN